MELVAANRRLLLSAFRVLGFDVIWWRNAAKSRNTFGEVVFRDGGTFERMTSAPRASNPYIGLKWNQQENPTFTVDVNELNPCLV